MASLLCASRWMLLSAVLLILACGPPNPSPDSKPQPQEDPRKTPTQDH